MKEKPTGFIAILLVLTLAACTTAHKTAINNGARCPDTGFLRGLDTTEFQADNGATYDVRMVGLAGGCRFAASQVILETEFYIVARERSSGQVQSTENNGKGDTLEIPYIATILTPDESVYTQQHLNASLQFNHEGGSLAEVREKLVQKIPLADVLTAKDYKVVYHFEAPDQN